MWLGSQATKPLRYALAALMSPAVDRLISATQRRLGLSKKAEATRLLVVSMFGFTVLFCGAVVAVAVAKNAIASTAAAAGRSSPASSSAALVLLSIGDGGRGLGPRRACLSGGVEGKGEGGRRRGGVRAFFLPSRLCGGARDRASALRCGAGGSTVFQPRRTSEQQQ